MLTISLVRWRFHSTPRLFVGPRFVLKERCPIVYLFCYPTPGRYWQAAKIRWKPKSMCHRSERCSR